MTRQFSSPASANSTYFRQFDCGDIFNGVVVETDIDNVDTLSRVHGVANVWPMKTVPMASGIRRVKAALDFKSHNYSVHQWTGVDQLHTQGIRGKGATIAIIDTGIDYTHRAVSGLSSRYTDPLMLSFLSSLAAALVQAARLLEAMISLVLIVSPALTMGSCGVTADMESKGTLTMRSGSPRTRIRIRWTFMAMEPMLLGSLLQRMNGNIPKLYPFLLRH